MKLASGSFDYRGALKKVQPLAYQNRYMLIGLSILALFSFVILRINGHTQTNRDEDLYSEKITAIKKVKFDRDVIKQIEALKDLNVNIGSDLPDNRTNPFR